MVPLTCTVPRWLSSDTRPRLSVASETMLDGWPRQHGQTDNRLNHDVSPVVAYRSNNSHVGQRHVCRESNSANVCARCLGRTTSGVARSTNNAWAKVGRLLHGWSCFHRKKILVVDLFIEYLSAVFWFLNSGGGHLVFCSCMSFSRGARGGLSRTRSGDGSVGCVPGMKEWWSTNYKCSYGLMWFVIGDW